MNEQSKINEELTSILDKSEIKIEFLPGNLNSRTTIEQYNLIINEGAFIHKKNSSGNKSLVVIEDNELNNIFKILKPEIEKLNVFVKVGFDFEDIDVIGEYDKIFLNVDNLENSIIRILNYTCKYSIQTIILTKKPKLFLDYNAFFSTFEVETIEDSASIRSKVMFILNESKKGNSQNEVKDYSNFRKDGIFSLHDKKMDNKVPFYRFNKSYINFKNIDQEHLNRIVRSEVEILIKSSFDNCYIGVAFIKLSLLYGLNRCLTYLKVSEKKSESNVLSCVLLLLRVLSIDKNYFSEEIESPNLNKLDSIISKLTKFNLVKVSEIMTESFTENESLDFQDKNLFKIIQNSGFLNSKLIKSFQYKVNEFHEHCNYSIVSDYMQFDGTHIDCEELSSYFLDEFLFHGKFNQYTLHHICKNFSKSIIQYQSKFLRVGSNPIVHFVIGHLILNDLEISQYNELCEKYSSVIFSEHQKSLISFYITHSLPSNFQNNRSFLLYLYDYFISELKNNNPNNRFSPQFGISNPVLPLYLSFVKKYDSDDNYHNLCLLIFSNFINYEWIFDSSDKLSKTFSYPNLQN